MALIGNGDDFGFWITDCTEMQVKRLRAYANQKSAIQNKHASCFKCLFFNNIKTQGLINVVHLLFAVLFIDYQNF